MAKHPRSLRVESVEDRLAPATMVFMPMGYMNPGYGSYYPSHNRVDLLANSRSFSAYQDYGTSTYYFPRADLFAVSSGYGRPVFVDIIVWRGNWNTVIQVSPAPEPTVTGDPTTPGPTTPSSGGPVRPTTHTTPGNTDSSSDRSAASSTSTVSIPVGQTSGPAADGNGSTNSGAEQANRAVTPNLPAVAFESRPGFGHLAVPILSAAEIVDIVPPVGPQAPQSEEPPLAQEEPPAPLPDSRPSNVPPQPLTANEPLAGVFPFNLTAIETGVRGVLDRVAGLEKTWSETPAGTEDYLWLAAASLVAGGIAQAAWTRRIRPTDPRTLGLDSVLARWGEKYVG